MGRGCCLLACAAGGGALGGWLAWGGMPAGAEAAVQQPAVVLQYYSRTVVRYM
jgi:hypothetical protein